MLLDDFGPRGRAAFEAARRSAGAGRVTVADLAAAIAGAPRDAPAYAPTEDNDPQARGAMVDALVGQAVASAQAWATQRGEPPSLEHLLVVIIDQGDPDALGYLRERGLDPAGLRQRALETLGGPSPEGPVPLVPLPPMGTVHRSAMPVSDLPQDLWGQLCRRQDRLPLRRIRRRSDCYAVGLNEQRAVMRLADRHRLDDDQRYSLLSRHIAEVNNRIRAAVPGALPEVPAGDGRPVGRMITVRGPRPPRWLRRALNPFRGWGTWVGNRRVEVRAAYLRLIRMG
ncbi:MAG TPA: Clp protease N-terminal domain-containing protein [Actinomycetota bacterium]|nr:Clp protease N-terminal domain-containing protein [Actinomycetota bacterium]